MKNPFGYGGIVSNDSLCNRTDKLAELMRAIRNSGDIVARYSLASPIHPAQGMALNFLLNNLIEFSSGTYYISDRFMSLWLQRRFAASHLRGQ